MKRIAAVFGIPVGLCLLIFLGFPHAETLLAQQCPQGYTLSGGRCVVNGAGAAGFTAGAGTLTGPATNGVSLIDTTYKALATGPLCNTTTTGVPSICAAITVTGAITAGSGSAVGGALTLVQGTTPTLTTNGVSWMAPSSVTAYGLVLPGAAPAANQSLIWGAPSSGISTGSFASVALLGSTNNFTANSSSGIASMLNNGTWASGVTSCHTLIQPAGTTPMTAAGGAAFCINAPTGNSANYMRFTTNGSNAADFTVSSNGSMTAFQATTTGYISAGTWLTWSSASRSLMGSPSDGVIEITNNSAADFNRLQFGGTTSSFPALKRSTTVIQARLADDSAAATLQGKYNSSDGSAGVTGSTCSSYKDGLCVAP